MIQTTATVQVKNPKGEVIAKQDYSKVNFHGTEVNDKKEIVGGSPEQLLGDAIAFYQKENPKGNGVLDLLADATYAHDLGVRAAIRQNLVTSIAGPEKAIEKQIKDFMVARAAMGKPVTEDVARARVMAMMDAD